MRLIDFQCSHKKCQGIIKFIEVYLWKAFENTWTQVLVYYESDSSLKTRRVFTRREKIFVKFKKMRGEEETILMYKVKAKDRKHLTNKKPILDITSQDRIPIL